MTNADSTRWWPTIASGVLWGVVVGLLDTLGEPLDSLSAWELAHFAVVVFLQWFVVGQLWAAAARLAESRGRALLGFFATLPLCCAAVVINGIFIQQVVLRGSATGPSWLINNVRDVETVVYLAWENAFYGGIYMLGYVATRRSVRLRQRLAETLRARGEADMLLREAQLRAYRGQLQPDLMIAALASLRANASSDPAAAGLTFDRLVTFLRAAMPAIRTGHSTLVAELMTLKSYGALREVISGAAVDVCWTGAIPDVPFPPLILLPTLEAVAVGLPLRGQVTLRARSTGAGSILKLVTNTPVNLPADIANQLRATLRLAFGGRAQVVTRESGNPVLEVRLGLPPSLLAMGQSGASHALS